MGNRCHVLRILLHQLLCQQDIDAAWTKHPLLDTPYPSRQLGYFWASGVIEQDREVQHPYSSLLKKGTGSEPACENAAENNDREVPVPLFQQTDRPARYLAGNSWHYDHLLRLVESVVAQPSETSKNVIATPWPTS
jgi:hypothetical protein